MVDLHLPWKAYVQAAFDGIYNAHAERLGHRPAFTVTHGGDFALVTTIEADADAARAIIADLILAAAMNGGRETKLIREARRFMAGEVDKFEFYHATRWYPAARVAEAIGTRREVVLDRRRYLRQLAKV